MGELDAIVETGALAAAEWADSELSRRKRCPNCGHDMAGRFCADCGQPGDVHRRSMGRLAHEFVEEIATFDSRILRTMRALLARPGELPTAFREGRTQRYVPAIRLYFFVTLLFFLFLSVSGIAILQINLVPRASRVVADSSGKVYRVIDGRRELLDGFMADAQGNVSIAGNNGSPVLVPNMKADGSPATSVLAEFVFFAPRAGVSAETRRIVKTELAKFGEVVAPALKDAEYGWTAKRLHASLVKLEEDPAALNGPLTTWVPRMLFLLLPLFALLLALFYRRSGDYLFVDHLVFSLSLHSFVFVVLIAAAALAQVIPRGLAGWSTLAVLLVYLLLSLRRFYDQSWIRTGLKFAGITVIYSLVLAPALAGAVVAGMLAD